MAEIQSLLSALDVFSRAPDKTSLDSANNWLQEFQHSPEAWSTCNVLLLSPDAPPAAKQFAAQTFRMKVTYDLHQVDEANLLSLRDTLVTAIEHYHSGPRTILIQLCLAVSGLALQLPAWRNPVETLIEKLGKNPVTVPALLHFLTVLPEELTTNTKIPVTDDEYRERAQTILTANAKTVLDLLSMYIQASGVTSAIQAQIFNCLRSWLVAGEISAQEMAATPLLGYAFEALASDELFDAAVDVICDLIHETQEIEDNMPVIEVIVPRVIALRPKLQEVKDDVDKVKGYARIFTEAGETYRLLVLQHTETFFPIVEAIGECSAYPDLDVVPITFHFWMRLAQSIGKKPTVSPLFLDAYKTLMVVIIRHLHFPTDMETLVGQDADDFRSFRHIMGDTLKDCCYVLGTETCLMTAYDMIVNVLARGPSGASWQEIEAPLFSMRSMGAEVDPTDKKAVPKIMDLIPTLPDHPRIRYAALLIISRYTEWINAHPEYIQFQLQYISAGFEAADAEVNAAAGQALKYLCQDCRRHLVDFLPQLHTFLSSVGAKLSQEDKMQVYEAIAYVISAMPMEQAAQSLRTFSMDILAKVHAIVSKGSPATKQELQDVCNGLENLEVMLHVVQSFGEELPPSCQNTCHEAWTIFDAFLAEYQADYEVCERATRVLRHGMHFFGSAVLPIAPSVLARMSTAFERTGLPSYIWIAGKLINRFGNEENPELRNAFRDTYERSTTKVVSLLQLKAPQDMPDVMEDYLRLLLQMIDYTPDLFFQSSAFPLAFRIAMAALTMIHSDIIFASLDLFRMMLTHDCLDPPAVPPPKFPIYAAAIRAVVEKEGLQLVGYLLSGLVGDFPEDSTSVVVTIFRVLTTLWPTQMLSWLPQVLQQLPTSAAPHQVKTQFLADVTGCINSKQPDRVKYAMLALHRASRRARDRRRMGPLDS
ncbi:ARM repeat-containing protein [Gloeophyllum trabeum ATCC 11539]|uniref:ARM repeat-containing protein n=1 Tax=Gloeophyllum trabeum (strain ATCC 11539 / FP-39264 / Madison 617) TaxID=670483 RepID=S7S402_GLOTA|nr:ARM repeat-containing protein [Gloeophyllum trabeum ATCC 11539]EPQ60569.1 ARM repeat-containing protein [Gloeophyllum trabeum ATCC 11539]